MHEYLLPIHCWNFNRRSSFRYRGLNLLAEWMYPWNEYHSHSLLPSSFFSPSYSFFFSWIVIQSMLTSTIKSIYIIYKTQFYEIRYIDDSLSLSQVIQSIIPHFIASDDPMGQLDLYTSYSLNTRIAKDISLELIANSNELRNTIMHPFILRSNASQNDNSLHRYMLQERKCSWSIRFFRQVNQKCNHSTHLYQWIEPRFD